MAVIEAYRGLDLVNLVSDLPKFMSIMYQSPAPDASAKDDTAVDVMTKAAQKVKETACMAMENAACMNAKDWELELV